MLYAVSLFSSEFPTFSRYIIYFKIKKKENDESFIILVNTYMRKIPLFIAQFCPLRFAFFFGVFILI